MAEVVEEYHINDWEECEYCKCVYWEHDTGYGEYDCQLLECECLGDGCPLSFEYTVEE